MIDKLEMLIALERERHFGRAAEACHVTQPSLSSAIKALEEQFGAQLVHRGSRYIGLTPEGERVLARARVIVAEARAIQTDLEQARNGLTGWLRLGVIPTAMATVHAYTGPFLARNPELRLHLRSMTSQDIVTSLFDFDLDAGFSYSAEDLDLTLPPGMESLPLYRERYALVRAAAAAPYPPRITWAEIAGLRLCLLTRDMQNRKIIDRLMNRAGLLPDPVIEANSIVALISHVRQGGAAAGLATILPVRAAAEFTRTPGLVATPIDGNGPDIRLPEFALILPVAGRRSLLLERFVAALGPIGRANEATEQSI